MTNAGSSARMFAGTVATLGCAFLLLMVAGAAVVVAITREANRLEAQRQRERIEAAFNNQIRSSELRLEKLAIAGDFQETLRGPAPRSGLQAAFERLRGQFTDFDGAYIVSSSGAVLAGIEASAPAGQTGYDGLRHFSDVIPGGNERPELADSNARQSSTWSTIASNGSDTIILMVIDLSRIATPVMSASMGPLSFVGYRRLSGTMLAELADGYRVAGIRLVDRQPADPLSSLPVSAPDASVSTWLTWSPGPPGPSQQARGL